MCRLLGLPGMVAGPDPIKAPGPNLNQALSVETRSLQPFQMAAPLQEQSALGWTNRKPVRLINEALRSLLATVWVPAT